MTKEEMDQAVKDIHKYFVDKQARYYEVEWVLDILKEHYLAKKEYAANGMLIDDVGKTKTPELRKERLF